MHYKKQYLEKTEIKVKNLLSDFYEDEADTLTETRKVQNSLNTRINDLNNHYSDISKQRKDLQNKFEQLKDSGDLHWDIAKREFELTLNYIEGDRENFIMKAEALIAELGVQIAEIENKALQSASNVKEKVEKKVDELHDLKNDLEEKLEKVKVDSNEKWRDVKHWFIEKSKFIKDYVSQIRS